MKEKLALPVALMIVLAISRIPGMLPQNFSAVYALFFCAGVFFPKRLAWWLPIVTVLITDIALNCYYKFALGIDAFSGLNLLYLAVNYGVYALLIFLGRSFSPKSSFLSLLSGGILGAILFYIITNTASWLFNPFANPEYTKTIQGWFTALTKGTVGWPQTWEFFRNTLMSGGLFTGLFVGAMKLNEAAEAKEPEEAADEEEQPAADKPEEAKA